MPCQVRVPGEDRTACESWRFGWMPGHAAPTKGTCISVAVWPGRRILGRQVSRYQHPLFCDFLWVSVVAKSAFSPGKTRVFLS
jgi:hypothetical protein